MLIIGIRHKITSELDARRSALFTRYLFHYLRMFAIMGVIIPMLVIVDYYCKRRIIEEPVIIKNIVAPMYDNIEYHIFTDNHHIKTESEFYDNTNIGDIITFHFTAIFKLVTNVSSRKDGYTIIYTLSSIYGGVIVIVIVVLTFVTSAVFLIKTWRQIKNREYIKSNFLINLGIINAFMCLMTLVAVIFHVL